MLTADLSADLTSGLFIITDRSSVFLLQVALYSMYVATMAFHAKVSDPVIGGTYMTLLNTVTNLGGNWPSTLALWLVDPLTSKECQGAPSLSCGSPEEAEVSVTLHPRACLKGYRVLVDSKCY